MKPKVLNNLDNALDEILSEYGKDHHIIFDNDSERRKELYCFVNAKLQSWKKSKKCIYRNCTNKSIKHSHSIQRAGPLKEIAKDSKVLTPKFNQETGMLELVEKGLSQASTFPGFCKKHEALFSLFENNTSITNDEAISLQIYRSICREVVWLKHEIMFGKKLISEYEKSRDKKIKIILKEKLGASWMEKNDIKVKNITLPKDTLINSVNEKYSDLMNTVEELENQHLAEIEECLKINVQSSKGTLSPVWISIDEQIPVALSGIGSFCIAKGNHSKQVYVVLLVLPDAKGTNIVIHGKSSDTKHFHGYLSRLKDSFDILNMVEQWMIRCTDHWFLSPDVWDQKNQDERSTILQEILDDTKGLTEELDFSIFDDLRRSMIKTWKTMRNTKKQLEILCCEQAKLRD